MWTTIRSDRRALPLAGVAIALSLLVPSQARAGEPADVASVPSPPAASPPTTSAPAASAADPLDSLRERFREGMDKYKAAAFADAIVIWESIYRELGPETGYRLAFDLARAYDQLGEAIKAADHYDTYLEKVRSRRDAGETLEPNVAKQEEIARERRDAIVALKGRIVVTAPARGTAVGRIDNAPRRLAPLVVYVEPGAHSVALEDGHGAETRTVQVRRGEGVTVTPRGDAAPPEPLPPQPQTRIERPFSPVVLWVGAGVALASIVVPVITYANALSIKSEYEDTATPAGDRARLESDYESARSNAYASVAVPALFTATVGALSLWYVLGAKETRVPVVPSASVDRAGASLGLSGSF
jgi:hypothetical protein